MTDTQPAVSPGQIWQECDPRFDRYVYIVSVGADAARIISCGAQGNHAPSRNSRLAKLSRFNGKRSGYRFVKEKEA